MFYQENFTPMRFVSEGSININGSNIAYNTISEDNPAYKWLNTNNLSLAAMVDDILNTNSDYFRDYVLKRIESNNMVSELPKAKDKFNELL